MKRPNHRPTQAASAKNSRARHACAFVVRCWSVAALLAFAAAPTQPTLAADPATEEPKAGDKTPAERTPAERTATERYRDLQKRLSGSVFEGQFTIDGQPDGPKQEMYELQSVTKLPTGDLWLFKTRIRYGGHDVTVPLPIPIQWAKDTPVISVDQLNVPGLGVFDARVVISGDRYAGTWQHGDVGGHLFGRIVKKEAADAAEKSQEKPDANPSDKADRP